MWWVDRKVESRESSMVGLRVGRLDCLWADWRVERRAGWLAGRTVSWLAVLKAAELVDR